MEFRNSNEISEDFKWKKKWKSNGTKSEFHSFEWKIKQIPLEENLKFVGIPMEFWDISNGK